jgi:hypothetical protein
VSTEVDHGVETSQRLPSARAQSVRWRIDPWGELQAFDVQSDELPLFAELRMDASSAATDQCAETAFALVGGRPGCAANRAGTAVRCR